MSNLSLTGNGDIQNFTVYQSTQSNFPEINLDEQSIFRFNLIGIKVYPQAIK